MQLVTILCVLAVLLAAPPYVHIFQLESYKLPQLRLRLREDESLARRRLGLAGAAAGAYIVSLLVLLVVCTLALSMLAALPKAAPLWVTTVIGTLPNVLPAFIFALPLYLSWRKWRRQPAKKPLVVTARVKRLLVALAVVLYVFFNLMQAAFHLLAYVLSLLLSVSVPLVTLYTVFLVAAFVAVMALPFFLGLAARLAAPVERAVQRWYLNDARRKLAARPDLIRVGITGSYGKTSVKVILATLLRERYNVLSTPSSFNTPMGLTRVIREQLSSEHEVFIAEMGARHVGDIAELCALVQPRYGLLTSVGPQHLETFFTLENVARTKYELVEALPEDGMAFLPQDDGICLKLYRQTKKPKALFGLSAGGEKLAMTARDVTHGPEGSSFLLVGPGGHTARCTTRLLGLHNIQNILGAAAVAHALGLTLAEIAAGIAKAEPVEHRLQLVPTGNGVTVIDDAFNSNPAGCRAALAVLGDFPGRKIIVTPGLVELGDREEAENEAFGREMAGVVDVAILVARNGQAMARGLRAAGFGEENFHVVGRLSDATAILGQITQAGDVVLFENDLPDHYES